MSKYTGPDCKLCRREGCKLFLKGDKCFSDKCVVQKRPQAPGQHGTGRKKPSAYQIQLREKQKTKRIYGLAEKQFRGYFEKAAKMRGVVGDNMLILLERRLDNVIFRLGIGVSRAQARQVVNHGHITINGKRVNIPSYLVKAGDIIEVKENKRDKVFFEPVKADKTNTPAWLSFDNALLKGEVKSLPTREDIDLSVSEHLIVELYSK